MIERYRRRKPVPASIVKLYRLYAGEFSRHALPKTLQPSFAAIRARPGGA